MILSNFASWWQKKKHIKTRVWYWDTHIHILRWKGKQKHKRQIVDILTGKHNTINTDLAANSSPEICVRKILCLSRRHSERSHGMFSSRWVIVCRSPPFFFNKPRQSPNYWVQHKLKVLRNLWTSSLVWSISSISFPL